MADMRSNLAVGAIASVTGSALTATSITLTTGHGARFVTNLYVTLSPSGVIPDFGNSEIVRVVRSGDNMTITRAQLGTTAKSIAAGWVVSQGVTSQMLTDVSGVIDVVMDYGADPGDTGNQLTAFANAKAAAIAAGVPLRVPPGIYRISGGSMAWRTDDLVVLGAGPRNTIIKQMTANTPVILAGGQYQMISGIGASYATQPATTDSNALAWEFGSSFMSTYHNLRAYWCATGLAIEQPGSGSATVFSCSFKDIEVNGWRDNAIWFDSFGAVNGTPNRWDNIYLHNNPVGTPENSAFSPINIKDFDGNSFGTVNVEECLINTAGSVVLCNVGAASFECLHVETVTLSAANSAIIAAIGDAAVQVRDLELQSVSFANSGNPQAIVSTQGGSGTGTSTVAPAVTIDGLRWLPGMSAPATPSQFVFHRSIDGTAARVEGRMIDPRAPFSSKASGGGATTITSMPRAPLANAFVPADIGYIATNFDPAMLFNTATILSASGVLHHMRIRLDEPELITNIVASVGTAGVSLTANQCLAFLYDSAGAKLATTVNQATAWQSTGLKVMALTAPITLQPGYYYVSLVANGTTRPAFAAASPGSGVINGGLAASAARFATSDTGVTTSGPSTLGSRTATAVPYWVALS